MEEVQFTWLSVEPESTVFHPLIPLFLTCDATLEQESEALSLNIRSVWGGIIRLIFL